MENKIIYECDVLVVGAGPSGVPAAVAAARQGARVILLEEDTLPGGAPVDMYVCMTCGEPRVGIYREMIEDLNARHTLDGSPILPFNGGMDGCNHWWMPHSYISAILRLLDAEPNLTLMTGLRAEGLLGRRDEKGELCVEGVTASHGVGREEIQIHAKVTVDCTGTGILGELAGCDVRYGADTRQDFGEEYAPQERGGPVMPCTLKYITQRLRGDTMPQWDELSGSGFVEDKLCNWASALYNTARKNNRGVYLHWGATVSCGDTRDSEALGTAHLRAMRMIERDTRVWYRHGFTVHVAPKLGVRECRRVMGGYVLTLRDVLEGNFEHDTVAVSSYGIDLWGAGVDKKTEKALNQRAKTFGIPYRCLIPTGAQGLLMAGKSISGSRFACSSYRVQPIVSSIGQACGVAAAICATEGCRLPDLSVTRAQSVLQRDGVAPA